MISLREFTRQDFDMVKEFYGRAYNGDIARKEKAFRWLQSLNTFDENNNYILIFVDGKLVGYWGLMPIRIFFYGQPFFALFSHETLIDPYYRRQGLAKKLLSKLNKSNRLIASLWHNEKIMDIKNKGGWFNIGKYRPLKKIYNLENIVNFKLKNQFFKKIIIYFSKPYFRIRHSDCNRIQSNYDIELVLKCDNEFDHLFMNVAPKLGILSDRTSAILNWKYIDIPHKDYIFLATREKGRISAYAVLRIDEQDGNIRKGIIVDILGDPDKSEPVSCLVRKCEEIFLENKVDFSVCLVQPEIFRNIFKKNGYYQAKSKKTDCLLIFNEDKIPNKDKELVKNINNWYLTYGDSDGDMW